MTEPTISLIDWRRLRFHNPIRAVWDALIIGILLVIGVTVLAGLRIYCVVWRGEHSWQHFPGNDFTPAMDSECSCCGARKPYDGPAFTEIDWDDD